MHRNIIIEMRKVYANSNLSAMLEILHTFKVKYLAVHLFSFLQHSELKSKKVQFIEAARALFALKSKMNIFEIFPNGAARSVVFIALCLNF